MKLEEIDELRMLANELKYLEQSFKAWNDPLVNIYDVMADFPISTDDEAALLKFRTAVACRIGQQLHEAKSTFANIEINWGECNG